MYTVYALKSKIKKYIYVGMTQNFDQRIGRHNNGYEKTTKPYKPFKLIHREVYPSRIEARKREKYLKSGVGKEFLKTL